MFVDMDTRGSKPGLRAPSTHTRRALPPVFGPTSPPPMPGTLRQAWCSATNLSLSLDIDRYVNKYINISISLSMYVRRLSTHRQTSQSLPAEDEGTQ